MEHGIEAVEVPLGLRQSLSRVLQAKKGLVSVTVGVQQPAVTAADIK
jgi:hypothetical protein